MASWEEVLGVGAIIRKRVAGIRRFFLDYSPDYLYVPVSGGKDSAAVWGLVARAGVPYVAVFIQIPGQTVADNIAAVEGLAKALGVKDSVTVVVKETEGIWPRLSGAIAGCRKPCLMRVIPFTQYGEDFWGAMLRYGFPAPLGRFGMGTRWCCGTFKHRVLNRLPYNGRLNGRPWRFGVNGIKATDSPYRRKKYREDVMTWESTKDTYYFPLRTLTDDIVWRIMKALRLAEIVRPQYERWGRAPNCFFCPMLGKRAMAATVKAMTPQQRALVVEHLRRVLPRYKEGTYSYRSIKEWLEVIEGEANQAV